MKTSIKSVISAAIVFTGILSNAQQLHLYSQYSVLPFIMNPAFAGSNENASMSLIHKNMWRDIPGAPIANAITFDSPIQEKNIGIGGIVYNDATDITQRFGFTSAYSYNLKIDDDNKVLFGLTLGLINNRIDFNKAVVIDKDDPFILQGNVQKTVFDGGFGAAYIWKDLQVGVNVPQLFANKIEYSNTNTSAYYYLTRHYQLSAKYNYALLPDKGISVYPLLVFRYAQNTPLQYDINAVLDWDKKGWFALTYRSGYALGINAGVKLNNTLRLGYAYDLAVGSIAKYAGGTHEILLGYTFGKKDAPVDNNASVELYKTQQELKLMDSTMQVLNKQNTERKEEIDQLKQQLEVLKTSGNSTTTDKPKEEEDKTVNLNDSTGKIRKDKVADYKYDDTGENVIPQYYVIVGAFKNKEGADGRKAEFVKRGFNSARIMFNDQKKLYYVAATQGTMNEDIANKDLDDAKYGTPDAWILILK